MALSPVSPTLPDVPQTAPATYMTPEWMNQTAQVLQTNPDAARKWFLGTVAGLARKKGLNYYLVAQDPQTQDVIEGGQGLTLDQALAKLRRPAKDNIQAEMLEKQGAARTIWQALQQSVDPFVTSGLSRLSLRLRQAEGAGLPGGVARGVGRALRPVGQAADALSQPRRALGAFRSYGAHRLADMVSGADDALHRLKSIASFRRPDHFGQAMKSLDRRRAVSDRMAGTKWTPEHLQARTESEMLALNGVPSRPNIPARSGAASPRSSLASLMSQARDVSQLLVDTRAVPGPVVPNLTAQMRWLLADRRAEAARAFARRMPTEWRLAGGGTQAQRIPTEWWLANARAKAQQMPTEWKLAGSKLDDLVDAEVVAALLEEATHKPKPRPKLRRPLKALVRQHLPKIARWVADHVAEQHATKHGPDLGLVPDEYKQLAVLLSKVKTKRPVNKRRKGKNLTEGFDLSNFRVVTTPEGEVVSLYQKAAEHYLPFHQLARQSLAQKYAALNLPWLGGGIEALTQGGDDTDQDEPQAIEPDPIESDLPKARRFTPEQLQQLADFIAMGGGAKTAADAEHVTWVDARDQSPHTYYALRGDERKTLAYLKAQEWGDGYFLSNFWVSPSERSKGHGGKLLKHVISEVGNKPLYLEAEPYDNGPLDLTKLKKFYAKHGFVEGQANRMRRAPTKE